MRVVLSFTLALFLFCFPAVATMQSAWGEIAQTLTQSTVFIKNSKGSCTGFVVHDHAKGGKDKDDDVDYVLTAEHCNGPDLYVDKHPATVKTKDDSKDLMILEVEDLERPQLTVAKRNPKVGDEVASYGYGYGLERPLFRVAHVSDDQSYIPFEGVGGPLIALDASFVPGQSGGPVVNAAGQVVMIVQMGSNIVGLGVGAETLHDKVGRYFGK